MKILMINSQSMYFDNATGITLRSFFSNLENVEILEVFINPLRAGKKELFSLKNSYCLNGKQFFPNHFIFKNQPASNKTKNKHIQILKLLKPFLLYLTSLFQPKIDNELQFKIKEFKPELIYTLGNDLPTMKLVRKASDLFNINVTIHHMDNWAEKYFSFNFSNKKKILLDLYKKSKVSMAISDELSVRLEKLTRVRHLSLMNITIPQGRFKYPNIKNTTIAYFGGLHLGREKVLMQLFDEFKNQNYDNSHSIKLFIYSNTYSNKLLRNLRENNNFVLCNPVTYNEGKKLMKNFDFLIHFESNYKFDFIKYSISTKIPDYLSVQRPILFIGDSKLTVFKFIKNNKIGFCYETPKSFFENFKKDLFHVESNNFQGNIIKAHRENCSIMKLNQTFEILKSMNAVGEKFQ